MRWFLFLHRQLHLYMHLYSMIMFYECLTIDSICHSLLCLWSVFKSLHATAKRVDDQEFLAVSFHKFYCLYNYPHCWYNLPLVQILYQRLFIPKVGPFLTQWIWLQITPFTRSGNKIPGPDVNDQLVMLIRTTHLIPPLLWLVARVCLSFWFDYRDYKIDFCSLSLPF
jgi:hypothetical protein